MTANTPQDYDGKIGLLEDTFAVLDVERVLKGDEEQIGGYDLICRGNPIRTSPTATFASYLGAFNNRGQQLKKLAKCTAARLGQ
jgi:tubulin polyglutamylase TTLL9